MGNIRPQPRYRWRPQPRYRWKGRRVPYEIDNGDFPPRPGGGRVAIKAREDEQRLINEAEAYKNEILPKSRGAAARRRQEAKAYEAQVIAQADGETERFTKSGHILCRRLHAGVR